VRIVEATVRPTVKEDMFAVEAFKVDTVTVEPFIVDKLHAVTKRVEAPRVDV